MNFDSRKVHCCSKDEPLYEIIWKEKPDLLAYLMVKAKLSGCLFALIVSVLFFQKNSILCTIIVVLSVMQMTIGFVRWCFTEYVITRKGLYVSGFQKRYWLAWDELHPMQYAIRARTIEKKRKCCTIAYASKPKTSAYDGPWRNKTVFWCIKNPEVPMREIETAHATGAWIQKFGIL